MESDANQKAAEQRKQAVAQLISQLVTEGIAGKNLDESALVAAHPELMPELQNALRKLSQMTSGQSSSVVGITAIPPAGPTATVSSSVSETPAIQIHGYSIQRELGRGGQAVVYLAIQINTGRKVAVKVMHPQALADERALARFKREVQVLAALDHPNIVGILDTGVTSSGSHFIVMSYVAGSTLEEFMKQRQRGDAADPARLLRLFLKICAAVNVAHVRGIVHRDLKPGNIRIDERGEPHILDFGLAHTPLDRLAGGEHPIAVTGEFLGSLPWCSPEQAQGDPDLIDMRSDVYSLGVILYQILTDGKFPYEVVGNIRDVLNNILNAEPTPPSQIAPVRASRETPPGRMGRPPVNEAIERIVLKALAKNRETRYQSAGELGRDVASYLSGQHTGERRVAQAPPPPPATAVKSSPGLMPLVIAAVVILLAVAAVAVMWALRNRVAAPPVNVAATGPTTQVAHAAGGVGDSEPEAPPPVFTAISNRRAILVNGTCHLEGDALALTPTTGNCMFYFSPNDWSNYNLSFQAMTNSDSADKSIRVMANFKEGHFFQIWLGSEQNSQLDLAARLSKTNFTRLQTTMQRLEPDRWYQVRVEVRGPQIRVLLDGQVRLEGQEEQISSGRLALGAGSPSVRYRQIQVTDPDGKVMWQGPPDLSQLPADLVDPPSAITPPDLHKTDLLSRFDRGADVLSGSWSQSVDGLAGRGIDAEVKFPATLPPEYDFRVSFIRATGVGGIALVASAQGHPFAWVVSAPGGITGFEQVNGASFDNNDTTRRTPRFPLTNGVIHTAVLRVRSDIILGYLDGPQRDFVRTEGVTLSLPPQIHQSSTAPLGVSLGSGQYTIKSVDLFPVAPRPTPATTAPAGRSN